MTNNDTDIKEIIDGCKANDRLAQEKLYRSFYAAMMNICLRYAKNETDALEVLNTGFYKVFKNIHRYDAAKASLYTWIRTIIINSCLNFLKIRDKKIPSQGLSETAETSLLPDIISKMNTDEVLNLLKQLPPATKAVFNMYIIDGFTHNEIGAMMNISEGTSKWHLSEARRILKQKITQLRDKE